MSTLYKLNQDVSNSTNSFLTSAPVELTSVKGYEDFINKSNKLNYTTVLKEDLSQGFVMSGSDVIANVYGEAKDYLVEQTRQHN